MTQTLFAVTLLSCSLCLAAEPSFDAASIRMSEGKVQPEMQGSAGTLTIRNQSVFDIIRWAYDTPHFQITAPAWMNEERFDILAKAESGGDETAIRLMLRKLLADRFGLQAHDEQKEMQIYAMTLSGQPKFKETTEDGPAVFTNGGPTMLIAHRATMRELAEKMSEPLQKPVIDETGLKGKYEIRIDVSGYLTDQHNGPSQDDIMSLLFRGIQEQLGLKLSSKKENVRLLVIDKMEKTPTDN